MTEAFDPNEPLPAGVTLLEASAGTGKTHSITSLVVRLVAVEEIPLERILIVTFTDAAAAELRERVRLRLRGARAALGGAQSGSAPAETDPELDVLAARVRAAGRADQALRCLGVAIERYDSAAIRTIHGFCQALLRDYAFECAAEVNAELLEDDGALLDEIARDFWATEVTTLPASVLRAPRATKHLTFGDVARLVTLAVRQVDAEVVPASPDAPRRRELGAEWAALRDAHVAELAGVAGLWREMREEVGKSLAATLAAAELRANWWTPENLAQRLNAADRWSLRPADAVCAELVRLARVSSDGSVKKGKTLSCMPRLDALQAALDAFAPLDAALRESATLDLLALQHRCVRFAREEFARRKRQRRLQTFDDLLHVLRDALRHEKHGPRIVALVRERFPVALVDEFQDTDRVQWEIFARLFESAGTRLVIIGDPKQAIYSFRGADIRTYLAAGEVATAHRSLGTNRRSDRPLVEAVNALFGRHEHPFAVPGIDYPQVGAHHAAARLRGDGELPFRIRLLRREGPLASDRGNVIAKGVLDDHLPRLVAADIARTLTSGLEIADGGGWRRVRPGDCAVLVRKGKQGRAMQEALRRRGVPSVLSTEDSVFHSAEANELARFLLAVLEPSNAHRARSALSTDLLGLAAADELRASGRWEGAGAPGIGNFLAAMEVDEAWADLWLERFRRWRACWQRDGVTPMLRAAMRETGLPAHLAACSDGERRLTNTLHLAELLHAAATEQRLEPAALCEWLAGRRADDDARAEESRRIRLESDADAVRLVTVHKSKGLEYPLVWIPWGWDGRMARRSGTPAAARLATGDRVISLSGVDGDLHSAMQDDDYAENLRLLYVAITRARHRCTVWWGAAADAATSALGYLLHGVAAETPAGTREETKSRIAQLVKGSDDEIRECLTGIATRSRAGISIHDERATEDEIARWHAHGAAPLAPDALAARPWTRRAPLDRNWRVGSFTSMTRAARGAGHDDEGPEAVHDAQPAPLAPAEEARGAPASLADFPRNAKAGIALHGVFEHADFRDTGDLGAVVAAQLQRTGFDAEEWAAAVAACVREVLSSPLASPFAAFRLGDIARDARLDELTFSLPVCGGFEGGDGAQLGGCELARAFRDHPGGAVPDSYADSLERLPFPAFSGFLSGAMDLVAEHDGRWYLIDYKSNFLGAVRAEYGAGRMTQAMADAHYLLQYHLYLVALDRWLATRIPDYGWDTHMGGVFYLFLRGMSREAGSTTGVWFDLPPRERIEALAQTVFGESRVPA